MRWWLIVVALAACHDKDAPPAAKPAVSAAQTPASHPPAPVLPGDAPPDPRGMPPAQGFANEEPDAIWKASTEKMLHDRLAKLRTAKIECRRTLCEVAVTGDQMQAVDQLQQLRDIAQSVTLTQESGQLRAYLRFDRPDE